MKAFDLLQLLKRLPPDAEVLIASAPAGGDGCFARPVSGVSQDREVGRRGKSTPVVVLHFVGGDEGKAWAARTLPPAEPPRRTAAIRDPYHHNENLLLTARDGFGPWAGPEELERAWNRGEIEGRLRVDAGWHELTFSSDEEARAFAARVGVEIDVVKEAQPGRQAAS